jgi:ferredoxin
MAWAATFFGGGMTGEHAFQKYRITREAFSLLVDSLMGDMKVVGPAEEGGQTSFRHIGSASELRMDYLSTMIPPSKVLFYRPVENILRFNIGNDASIEEIPPEDEKVLALGVHPCDMHAILYLDRVLNEDPYYTARRKNTTIVALNCSEASEHCFCSSAGTGPHLKVKDGYDLLLTNAGEFYLAEPASRRGEELIGGVRSARVDELLEKDAQEKALIEAMKKSVDMRGLDELFMKNIEHPVWARVAEERCLSCSNCVMVCPTCFCHDLVDETSMDLSSVLRLRRWDACHDLQFAAVHGGNFRCTRASRLRQFVMHKLNYTSQFGAAGTVGCGRCIKWCPTGIDLTEIAEEIRRSPVS